MFSVTNVQTAFPRISRYYPADTSFSLVYAVAHVHTGAVSATLRFHDTKELICDSAMRYGASNKAGDERGYLVGIAPCVFPEGLNMTFGRLLESTIVYNATTAHHGVMGLWLNFGWHERKLA